MQDNQSDQLNLNKGKMALEDRLESQTRELAAQERRIQELQGKLHESQCRELAAQERQIQELQGKLHESQCQVATEQSKSAALEANTTAGKEHLHWHPKFGERRGLGEAILKVNHVAIIVADVGRSAAFYSDVMGLQQVRRPNFDRHGAWFTMGNAELHLIKGNPVVASGDDLIVGHISLEVDPELIESGKIAERLTELGVHFRQNISVPDPKKSRENKFEGSAAVDGEPAKATTGVVQYFLRDPDGYWVEICNCGRLTSFVLGEDDADESHLSNYMEGGHNVEKGLAVVRLATRWKHASRHRVADDEIHILHHDIKPATTADPEKLLNLKMRRNTYGDVTQGHSDEEVEHALIQANNNVAIALELLKHAAGEHQVFQPPAWIEDGKMVKGPSFNHEYSGEHEEKVQTGHSVELEDP